MPTAYQCGRAIRPWPPSSQPPSRRRPHSSKSIPAPLAIVPRCVQDRVQEIEELHGPRALAEKRRRLHHPGGRIGILAAVFPDARDITFNVTRLQLTLVEGGREQEDQPVLGTNQELLDRRHGLRRAAEKG